MNAIKISGTIALLLFLLGVVGANEFEDEQESSATYCSMVELWEEDSYLPPEQRRGWPPYEGVEQCQ